jgi:uncharacterized membrane protein
MTRLGRQGHGTATPSAFSARAAALAGSAAALIIATLAGSSLTFWHQAACRSGAFNSDVAPLQAHCYSDIYALYVARGLVHGQIPYLDHPVEYPVLIGAAMQAAAWATHSATGAATRAREFYDLTTAGLVLCAIAGVLATAYLAGRSRRWTALLVALSPALILAAFINWDLLAMALTATAMAAWGRRRGIAAGVLFGLAVSAKFYPLFLLGALFLLCLRAGRLQAFWVTMATATVTWLAVNVPVAIAAFSAWSMFYRYSFTRGADWGSIWYFTQTETWWPTSMGALNALSTGLTVAAFALLAVLVLAAPRRPRVPQVFFLALAVFLMFSKVWSPQYVIWLVPLVVLARPRLWSFLLWQATEVGYYWVLWPYIITASPPGYFPGATSGIGAGPYFAALLARFLTIALLCALVVRDILRPDNDVIRRDGDDDPAGGVLAGAPDAVTLRGWARRWQLRPALRPPGGGAQ